MSGKQKKIEEEVEKRRQEETAFDYVCPFCSKRSPGFEGFAEEMPGNSMAVVTLTVCSNCRRLLSVNVIPRVFLEMPKIQVPKTKIYKPN